MFLNFKQKTHRSTFVFADIFCYENARQNIIFQYFCWEIINDYLSGACGVMVIIVKNEHSEPSSNPGWGCLHFKWH